MNKNNFLYNPFSLFLLAHLAIWTLIPYFVNENLPLDTIEALAWGSNLEWGFSKHPPISAFFVELFYQLFGNQDWAYYLLSQIFVIFSFFIVWKFSEEFFLNKNLSLISILLLEAIVFYNYTTPEFNVYVCQLPFRALTVYYCWKCFQKNNQSNWILLGIFVGLGFLTHYLFMYLILTVGIFFIYQIKRKKFNYNYLIPVFIFLIIISPHIFWLIKNNYSTITYGFSRVEVQNLSFLTAHLLNPLVFIIKQLILFVPFILFFLFLTLKIKTKLNLKNKKLVFLIIVNFLPILLVFFTSLILGVKIRTMWMSPFYLYMGVLFVYIYKKNINLKKSKKFFIIFLFLFILSPITYATVSILKKDKRTDFPGKEIAYLVQSKWDNNFSNRIAVIVGDEWFAGNLSYHLSSRPQWHNSLSQNYFSTEKAGGVIYVGNPKIMKKICPGVFGTIKPVGICMIGTK